MIARGKTTEGRKETTSPEKKKPFLKRHKEEVVAYTLLAFPLFWFPEMAHRYDFRGNESSRAGCATNDAWYLRFTGLANEGGVQIFIVNDELETMSILDPVLLGATEGYYQTQLLSMFSGKTVGIVLQNAAPEDSGTTATVTSFNVTQELDPLDRDDYYADMYVWANTVDPGFEPMNVNTGTGWSGWYGVSRGDLSHNNIAYLDGFGAALEYDNRGEGNLENDGVQMFVKIKIPATAKKLTYFAGHVNNSSAYRIQLFDGTEFVNLTQSSTKVNADNVAADAGWRLTIQNYDGSNTEEVAIPEQYAGQTVLIILSAKYDHDASYGTRYSAFRFSSEEVATPAAMSEGVDITALAAMTATDDSLYSFAADMAGFTALWGASQANGALAFAGADIATTPEDAAADAAVAGKITLPASFNYLRFTVNVASGATVQLRVRMIDLESNTSADVLSWKTVTGGADDQVIQVQTFPTTFVGTLGLVIETKYETQATLNLKSISFATVDRNEAGYDLDAMAYIPLQAMPENGKFLFDAANIGKWAVFTSNDDSNTKGFPNNIWMQLQSTSVDGEYSALCAYKATLGNYTSVTVKSGSIGAAADSSMIRVRLLKSDGTFVNLTKTGVTDENGWFDGSFNETRDGEPVVDYGWGSLTANTLDIPEGLAGEEVLIVIEYDREISTNWNVIIEYLQFNAAE